METIKQDGSLSEFWGNQIIEQLIHQGVRYFCLSPGSRSTPLALGVSNHPLAQSFVHYDERGMAFHALGYAKAKEKPVAIITSSGSAVGNLLPAIMEAAMQQIPLIVLTADRPPELRDVGANQTVDQVKIFTNFTKWDHEFPVPSLEISPQYIQSTIAHAVYLAVRAPAGPVHLNCLFRKLHAPESTSYPLAQTKLCPTILRTKATLEENTFEYLAKELQKHQEGIIFVGEGQSRASSSAILSLAKKLQWPIFPDILSHIRTYGEQEALFPYFDLALKANFLDAMELPAVLHFGDRCVSASLQEYLTKKKPSLYWHVTHHPNRIDPDFLVTKRIECNPNYFATELCQYLSQKPLTSFFKTWTTLHQQLQQHLDLYFQNTKTLSEFYLFNYLSEKVNEECALFIGNSMPIRDANAHFYPKHPTGPLFGNRGHSGIDGNIATTIGIAKALKKTTISIMGDLTFLHDLNSLAQIKQLDNPCIFFVMNNHGGGIFSFLPIADRQVSFEKYFAANHNYTFQGFAEAFNIDYGYTKTIQELDVHINKALSSKHSMLIEIPSDREENVQHHKTLIEKLKQANHYPQFI